jgi:phage FluMu protein Com
MKLNVIFNFSSLTGAAGLHFEVGRVTGAAQSESNESHDCRCVCGSLVARLVDGGVELKCRRCKRTVVVPITSTSPTAVPNLAAARDAR